MKHLLHNARIVMAILLLVPTGLQAQKLKKVRFNGLGRAYISNTTIRGEIKTSDTTTVNRVTEGEFLLDLGIDIVPNDKNEIKATLRLRNEFGGFFGAGMSIEIRELYAKGIIANGLRYHIGDMDLAMTPYTLYLNEEAGRINLPEVFAPQKEVIYYDQFYTDNHTRRMQGAKLDFGLSFAKIIDDLDFTAFLTRIRPTDFFTVPTRLLTGGTVSFQNRKHARVRFHTLHVFDDLTSGNANTGLRNPVYTADAKIKLVEKDNWSLHLEGEGGVGRIVGKADSITTFEKDDFFTDAGLTFQLPKKGISTTLNYRDVGPDFFSMAAQSKAVDFSRTKGLFHRIGNDQFVRAISLFDLGRDRFLYTSQLQETLMPYDPRLSNTFPYGKATPNRRGVDLAFDYQQPKEIADANLRIAYMSEIRGQGTAELKNFLLTQLQGSMHFHKWKELKRNLSLTIGLQMERTQRGGNVVEQIDLTSLLFNAGIEAELFKKCDLLLGTQVLSANGNEFRPILSQFNVIEDFPISNYDDTEVLLGAGLRYRFKDDIYLTVQYHTFQFGQSLLPQNDYNLNQVFVLYNMNF